MEEVEWDKCFTFFFLLVSTGQQGERLVSCYQATSMPRDEGRYSDDALEMPIWGRIF